MSETPTPTPQPTPAPKPADPKPAEPTPDEPKDMEFEVDEETGAVGTKVGSLGWPEGAENDPPAEEAPA